MKKYTVVRNNAYKFASVSLRYRHNERQNECYSNEDIVPEDSVYNVHFKQPDGTYENAFNKLVSEGVISTRGLKPDADVICEFVFDVNSEFFLENGDYDFAKKFYAEAYRFAVAEVGDERYVLSAVMHADEKNMDLSREKGKNIYHYHMHVVYVPVVDKEIRWSKRCKDEQLRGTVKEVIHQVSKSKKWASPEITTENGRRIRIPSYSLLQDRFYEHMKNAGFDVVRGERGSTAEHLSTLEYKTRKEEERLKDLSTQTKAKETDLREIMDILDKAPAEQNDPEKIKFRKTLSGKIEVSEEDYRSLVNLGKEAFEARMFITDMQQVIAKLESRIRQLEDAYRELRDSVRDYLRAFKLAPQWIGQTISDIFRWDREKKEQEARELELRNRLNRQKNHDYDYER